MPLGLPNYLAPRNVARAYSSTSHAIALYCLIGTFVAVLAVQVERADLVFWPCLLALLPWGAVLWLLNRRRSRAWSVAYLVVGAGCLYWYAASGALESSIVEQTDSFLFVLPKVALIFVGAGAELVGQIAWIAAALVIGELAVVVGGVQAGARWSFDVGATGCAASVVALLVLVSITRSRSAKAHPTFLQAVHDEQLSALRYRIEVKAAAMMHDTVLNHLAAIAASPAGPLPPTLRAEVTRDLEVLLGEEWLLDAELPVEQPAAGWRSSELFEVIEEARRLGLEVEVSGDVSVVSRLDREHGRALALAAKQCLVNVIRHAGVSNAEVVVYGTDAEVSVMVVDAGRGFTAAETGADRLGLRQSVRHRIEAVDGGVQVWSTPGRGTSVMIRVPATATDAASRSGEHGSARE